MFIGLMGLGADGTLYTPSGAKLFRVPLRVGAVIQRVQQWIARRTWH
jgi:hypothetical protein